MADRVREEDADVVLVEAFDVEEIAADVGRGPVDHADVQARDVGHGALHELLLHVRRLVQLLVELVQLARDVTAAVDALAEHDSIDAGRIGLCGYSQGGWVAPLAASMDARVRFVSVAYGMIESPFYEALRETQDLLRSRGVDEAGIREATPLVRASIRVVANGFEDGWEAFREAKRATSGAAWRTKLGGSPVEKMLRYPQWLTKILGPRLAPRGLDWDYSSDAVLDELSIPMTWLLAERDSSAPNHETIPKLRAYREAGKPYELLLFADADHGMLEFREEDGERVYTSYAPGYFEAEVKHVLRMSAAD